MFSTGLPSLDQILGDGYPDRSSILVVGQPRIGKEGLGYWFASSGILRGDYCLYVTYRSVMDVHRDISAFGTPMKNGEKGPEWIASSGSPAKCDLRDVTSISFNIKQAIQRNKDTSGSG